MTLSPGILAKSFPFLVIIVSSPFDKEIAPIRMSLSGIVWPFFSSVLRISPNIFAPSSFISKITKLLRTAATFLIFITHILRFVGSAIVITVVETISVSFASS